MANMPYVLETIAGTEYKLRLGARDAADVEKRLGRSALDVLLAMAPAQMPDSLDPANPDLSQISVNSMSMPGVGDICVILHGSMQKYQHGITLDKVYDLFDAHIDQGGCYDDFIGILSDVLTVSGFLSKKSDPEEEESSEPT